MSSDRSLITTRNLLAGHICENCNLRFHCRSKLKEQFNTCGRWQKEKNEFYFNIKSFAVKTKTRKLNVSWSKESELALNAFNHTSIEDSIIEQSSEEFEAEYIAEASLELFKSIKKKRNE